MASPVEQGFFVEQLGEKGPEQSTRLTDPNIESKIKVVKWLLAIETGLMRPWLVEIVYPDRVHEAEQGILQGT